MKKSAKLKAMAEAKMVREAQRAEEAKKGKEARKAKEAKEVQEAKLANAARRAKEIKLANAANEEQKILVRQMALTRLGCGVSCYSRTLKDEGRECLPGCTLCIQTGFVPLTRPELIELEEVPVEFLQARA